MDCRVENVVNRAKWSILVGICKTGTLRVAEWRLRSGAFQAELEDYSRAGAAGHFFALSW